MKKLAKKSCSVFLALALCLSLLQVPAFAANLGDGTDTTIVETAAETNTPEQTAPAETPAETSKDQSVDNNKPADGEIDVDNNKPADGEDDVDNNKPADGENDVDNNKPADGEDDVDNNKPADGETDVDNNKPADGETDVDKDNTDDSTPDASIEDADGTDTGDEETPEAPALSETAQKFLDAVAGLPDTVTEENYESISALIDEVFEMFGTLSDEELALVDPAFVKLVNLMASVEEMSELLEEDQSKTVVSDYDGLVQAIRDDVTEITLAKDFKVETFQPLNIVGRTASLILNLGEAVLSTDSAEPVIKIADANNPLELTLNGGTITSTGGNGIFVGKGSKLITNGVTITGNKGNGVTLGSGDANTNGGSFVMNKDTTISNNQSSGVFVGNKASFTMNDGDISNNTVTENNSTETIWCDTCGKDQVAWYRAGGGVYVNGGTFTMSGGTISNNATGDTADKARFLGSKGTNGCNHESDDYLSRGGGVAVMNGGTFNLSGKGTVSNNDAAEGGGVFISNKSHFKMEGGTVDKNTAEKGEGGGIYIKGEGTITSGNITGNETKTTSDLGGGGIYVENNGTLKLQNAIITDNEAGNFGGGIAACVHGKTSVLATNGAGVYGNTAKGNGGVTANEKVDSSPAWTSNSVKEAAGDAAALAEGAMDIFSAGCAAGADGNQGGALIGLIMLGGETANWVGWKIGYTPTSGSSDWRENGKVDTTQPITYEAVENPTGAVYGDRLLGLTSKASDDAISKAENRGHVFISGNTSAMNGGGIANNGILIIGTENSETVEKIDDLKLEKTLENVKDRVDAPSLKDGEFIFDLTTEDGEWFGQMTNNTNGKAIFDFSTQCPDIVKGIDKDKPFVFYVTENKEGTDENGVKDNVKYDSAEYKVTITASIDTVTQTILETTYSITTRFFTPTIQKLLVDENGMAILDENGDKQWEDADGISFNNVYTAPETPPEKPDEPGPGPGPGPNPTPDPDPDPTPTPDPTPDPDPEEPPIDVPDPDVPLVPADPEEPPVIDVPEEEPPLVDIPDTEVPLVPARPVVEVPEPQVPLVDIPEEDVPLADVPATGDNSGLWLAMSLAACAGLAYFFLEEKKRQNEAK